MNGFYPITAQTTSRRRASSSSSIPALASPSLLHTPSATYGTYASDQPITESPQSTTNPRMSDSYATTVYSPRTPLGTQAYPRGAADPRLSQIGETSAGADVEHEQEREREREFPTVSQGSRAPLLEGIKERDYADSPVAGPSRPSRRRAGVGKGKVQGRGSSEAGDTDTDEDDAYIFVDPPDPSPSPYTQGSGRSHPLSPPPAAASLPAKQSTFDPSLLPRPGPADAYVSRFLAPFPGSPITGGTQPPSPEPFPPPDNAAGAASGSRPSAPLRSSSAPGPPQPGAPFLPFPKAGGAGAGAGTGARMGNGAAGTGAAGTGAGAGTGEDGDHPLFRIFSAQLDTPAEEMVRRLKSHLGEVLRVQEEVGEMHLRLEGLGSVSGPGPGEDDDGGAQARDDRSGNAGRRGDGDTADAVQRREKGVEDIMKRLGDLSDSLRSYHTLRTPKLSFPPSASAAASASASRSASAFPSSPIGPLIPPSNHTASYPTATAQAQAQAQASAPPGPHQLLQSPPKIVSPQSANARVSAGGFGGGGGKATSPPSIENKRVQRLVPSSPIQELSRQQRHSPKVPSNLDQVTTADEGESSDEANHKSHPHRGHPPRHEDGKYGNRDAWLERASQAHNNQRDRTSFLSADAEYRQGFTSSPVEMADRSRPW